MNRDRSPGPALQHSDERSLILDTALQLLPEEGLKANFLQQLAIRCGLPPEQIHKHFPSATEVVETLLERELDLIAGSIADPELRFPGETLADELEALARTIVEEYANEVELIRVLLIEALKNEVFAPVFYRVFILQGRHRFTQFLEARKRLGELREDVDVEAAAAFFLSSLTFSVLLLECLGGKEVEAIENKRLVQAFCDLFLRGAGKQDLRSRDIGDGRGS